MSDLTDFLRDHIGNDTQLTAADRDSKLRIIDELAPFEYEWIDRLGDAPTYVLRQLAFPYEDKPGFLDEWRQVGGP